MELSAFFLSVYFLSSTCKQLKKKFNFLSAKRYQQLKGIIFLLDIPTFIF